MQKPRHAPRVGFAPFFFVLTGLALGEWGAFFWGESPWILILLSGLAFLFLAFWKSQSCGWAFLIALLLGALFIALSLGLPLNTGRGTFRGFVLESKANYYVLFSHGHRLYVYEKDCHHLWGEFVEVKGYLSPFESMEWEGRFSFKEYLRGKGIIYSLSASSSVDLFAWPISFRAKEVVFLSSFSSSTRAFLDALLFAHADYSSPLIQKAASLGALYFLSSSGVLYAGFLRGAEKLLSLRFSDEKSRRIVFALALPFLPIGLYKSGVIRVFLLRGYRFLKEERKGPDIDYFYVLSFAGLFQILLFPFAPLDTGFLLGYGVSFLLDLSRAILNRFPGKKKDLATSVFVLLFMLPVLASNNSLHLFSFAYSLVLMPLVYPFAFFGFLSFLTLPFARFLNGYGSLLEAVIGGLERVDVQIPLGDFSIYFAWLYEVCFVAFLYLENKKYVPFERGILLALSVLLATNLIPLGNAFTEEVSFLNVGQGDCILIRDGYTSVMIDTGGNLSFDLAQEVDIPFLRKEKIYSIDALIASHHDFDHIGAKESLMKHFPVHLYVDEASAFPLRVGDLLFNNYNVYSGGEENEESLVLSLSFMGKVWLFTGDAPTSIEKKILLDHPEIDCDILKVGHHGSDTSSSEEFLKKITPEVGIISVGRKNSYGHPKKSVLERFASLGIPLRRTDEEGTISYRHSRKAKTLSLKNGFIRYNIPQYDPTPLFAPIPDGSGGAQKTRDDVLPESG